MERIVCLAIGYLFGICLLYTSFSIIGATIADNFVVKMPEGTIGYSILDKLK